MVLNGSRIDLELFLERISCILVLKKAAAVPKFTVLLYVNGCGYLEAQFLARPLINSSQYGFFYRVPFVSEYFSEDE